MYSPSATSISDGGDIDETSGDSEGGEGPLMQTGGSDEEVQTADEDSSSGRMSIEESESDEEDDMDMD